MYNSCFSKKKKKERKNYFRQSSVTSTKQESRQD